MSGLREVLENMLSEWGDTIDSPDREAWKDRLLQDRNCTETSRKVAELAGLDINSERDARVLLNLLCLFAFTDMPKGANSKDWRVDVAFLHEVAEIARNIQSNKLSLLIAKMAPNADANEANKLRQRIARAYDSVELAFSTLSDKQRLNAQFVGDDLEILKKFAERKIAKRKSIERGAYKRR